MPAELLRMDVDNPTKMSLAYFVEQALWVAGAKDVIVDFVLSDSLMVTGVTDEGGRVRFVTSETLNAIILIGADMPEDDLTDFDRLAMLMEEV